MYWLKKDRGKVVNSWQIWNKIVFLREFLIKFQNVRGFRYIIDYLRGIFETKSDKHEKFCPKKGQTAILFFMH